MNQMNNDALWRERASCVIPNGMWGHEAVGNLPDGYPQFFSKAEGAYLWDTDDNKILDFMCAYGPNLLGYGDARVNKAAMTQMEIGDTLTGPSPLVVQLAEEFTAMVTHADWAIFCKNGGDATSMAMVTARAYKGRRKILVAKGAYHGASPWNTPTLTGTVAEDRAHILYFDYNDLDSLRAVAKEAGNDLAGVFATPFKHDTFTDQEEPNAEYAKGVRALCDEMDALLIVDDVRAGFRLARDCSWSLVGVEPDLSCWGKVLGNGQPISALLGSDKARAAAGSIFVTGSFWYSAVPMAAARETLRIVRETNYLEHMQEIGASFRARLSQQAAEYGFGLRQTGPVTMPMILLEDDPDFRYVYYWTNAAIQNGVYLNPYHNIFMTAAMSHEDIDVALEATGKAFRQMKENWSTIGPDPKASALLSTFGG
ncbi:aminotransferase class III-fold pyridoxal phosphate-dependent enzyme [Celeribacter sp. SCSIO 80788]|uniref:aminotransferase class III-fold pyridoxal phosphate-dependent enzyme n=1 Tax=Celeribacter sp. SCSIO 80788 TaxID=3117013 RepID=UPI003DA616DE